MTKNNKIASLVAASLVVVGIWLLVMYSYPSHTTPNAKLQKQTICYEDEPCWNCHTMGNHICGPLTK